MKRLRTFAPALLLVFVQAAAASPLVYVPVNPAFGGSPLNGAFLLGRAQAQDLHRDPRVGSTGFGAPGSVSQLDQFNNALQQSVLSRVSAAVSSSVVGADGRLIPGVVETQNFRITISDVGGGKIHIVTTDKTTNASTSFEISQ